MSTRNQKNFHLRKYVYAKIYLPKVFSILIFNEIYLFA